MLSFLTSSIVCKSDEDDVIKGGLIPFDEDHIYPASIFTWMLKFFLWRKNVFTLSIKYTTFS